MTKHEIIVYWSEEDQAFIAEAPELAGCAAAGPTCLEALANIEVVITEWIETAKRLGRPIPEPKGGLLFAEHGGSEFTHVFPEPIVQPLATRLEEPVTDPVRGFAEQIANAALQRRLGNHCAYWVASDSIHGFWPVDTVLMRSVLKKASSVTTPSFGRAAPRRKYRINVRWSDIV